MFNAKNGLFHKHLNDWLLTMKETFSRVRNLPEGRMVMNDRLKFDFETGQQLEDFERHREAIRQKLSRLRNFDFFSRDIKRGMNLFHESLAEPFADFESQLNEHSGHSPEQQLHSNDAVHSSGQMHSLSEGGKKSVWFSAELSGRGERTEGKQATVALGGKVLERLREAGERKRETEEVALVEEVCRLARLRGVVAVHQSQEKDSVEQLQMLKRWASSR